MKGWGELWIFTLKNIICFFIFPLAGVPHTSQWHFFQYYTVHTVHKKLEALIRKGSYLLQRVLPKTSPGESLTREQSHEIAPAIERELYYYHLVSFQADDRLPFFLKSFNIFYPWDSTKNSTTSSLPTLVTGLEGSRLTSASSRKACFTSVCS